MKSFKLLLIAVIISYQVSAQVNGPIPIPIATEPKIEALHKSCLSALMTNQVSVVKQASLAKSNGVQQRLVQELGYNSNADSVEASFSYQTNSGGSTFNYYTLTYDYLNDPYWDPFINAGPWGSGINIYCDDLYYSTTSFGGSSQIRAFKYRQDKQLQEMDNSGDKTLNDYDSSGHLKMILTLHYNGATWDTGGKRLISYDAFNNFRLDTIFVHDFIHGWTPNQVYYYNYDAYGNVTKLCRYYYMSDSSLYPGEQFLMDYYPSNLLKKVSILLYDNQTNTFNTTFVDTFGYSGNLSINTYWRSDQAYVGLGVVPCSLTVKHLNPVTALPDTATLSTLDFNTQSWNPYLGYSIEYNNEYNPLVVTTSVYDPGFPTWVFSVHTFTYETFDDLSVTNTPATNINITLYPNPSKQTLNISWDGFKQGTAITVSIINAAGQMIRKEKLNWMQQTETLNIANLQPGVYWINVNDANGKIFSQSFLKQ